MKLQNLLMIGAICSLAACGESQSQTPANETTQSQPAEKNIAVTATKLSQVYSENEVSADQVYKGKTLEVSGTVESISKDALDAIYVVLQGHDELSGVQLYVSDENKAALLKKGQSVTIQGRGDGMIIGSPIIKEGVIIK